MRKLFFVVLIAILLILGGSFLIGEAPEDLERANIEESEMMDRSGEEDKTSENTIENYDLSKLDFTFTGYGPGKYHDGKFKTISVSDIKSNGTLINSGKKIFTVNSIDTGIQKLDTDLCKENFFDCAKYPEIVFELKNVEEMEDKSLKATGTLTMKGISKDISFDARKIDNVFVADFVLDVNQFGFSAPSIVDNEVRIKFNASI